MEGIVRTRVGYSGGDKKDPTYSSLGNHTETLQVDFDPARISYEEILHIFWNEHDPTQRAWGRQYMSAIFYHNETQKALVHASKAREEMRRKKDIHTAILPLDKFYLAEDYHQKYQLRRHRDLMNAFTAMYPDTIDFVNSTAAARVNGYVGGYGSLEAVKANIEFLGLSAAARQRLLEIAE